jgi:hypothetical protein
MGDLDLTPVDPLPEVAFAFAVPDVTAVELAFE